MIERLCPPCFKSRFDWRAFAHRYFEKSGKPVCCTNCGRPTHVGGG